MSACEKTPSKGDRVLKHEIVLGEHFRTDVMGRSKSTSEYSLGLDIAICLCLYGETCLLSGACLPCVARPGACTLYSCDPFKLSEYILSIL